MTYNYEIDKLQYLQIGQEGNNLERYIAIDLSSWVEEYPDVALSPFVLFKAPDADVASAATSTWNSETHILTWEVTTAVTAVAGQGYTEIRVLDTDAALESAEQYSGLVKKSKVIPTYIGQSISGIIGGTRPSPYEDFLNQVLAVRTQLNEVFQNAVTEYAISNSGSTAPVSGWSTDLPAILDMKGKFLWTRVTFNWGTGESSRIHIINFVPDDTEGDVRTVNGLGGTVVLDAGDITLDKQDATAETIAAAIDRIGQAVEDINLVRMFYTPSVSTDAPGETDQLLVGTSSFPLSLTRRAFSDVLSAASIFDVTGGRVVKTTQVTLTRLPYEFNKAVATSDNASIRIRRGTYSGEINFNIADIPIAVVSISGNAWTHYELPVFDRVAGSVTRLMVQVPFTQMYVSGGVTPAETITAQIAYLAAT